MDFKIKKILLWPKKELEEVREIEFSLENINVISGENGKGKSAIISIIDYCLASGSCLIPTGLIRESVSWFGILVQFKEKQILLARKSPGKGAVSSEMYKEEGVTIGIPNAISSNCNFRDVINILNEYFEISDISLKDENDAENNPAKERVSIRDIVSFNFQPQHIVANPHALYYKADTFKNREKLKNIFTYALGIINNQVLEAKEELIQIRREIQKVEKVVENNKSAADKWLSEVRTYYMLAKEFGLLPNSPDNVSDVPVEILIESLRGVREFLNPEKTPLLEQGVTSNLAGKISNLRTREFDTSSTIEELKQTLISVENLHQSNYEYAQEVVNQRRRLDSTGWFQRNLKKNNKCPFCNSEEVQDDYIKGLLFASEELEEVSSRVSDGHKVISKEIIKLKNLLANKEAELNNIRKEQRALISESSEYNLHRQTLNKVYEFIGRLDESLRFYDLANEGNELNVTLQNLKKKESDLDAIVNSLEIKRRKEAALNSISGLIRYYSGGHFSAERSSSEIKLDIDNLTLSFTSPNGTKNYLWEIGSGHNFMAYHISTLLAIHQFLNKLDESKVPKFLVIDQPTQVYFPELKKGSLKTIEDKDLEKVRLIFKALSDFFDKVAKGVQIIILEHVGESGWENLSNIKLIKRWREGEEDGALIPSHWIIEE